MALSGDWQWDYDFFGSFTCWHSMSSARMLNQLLYLWSFTPAELLQNWVLGVASEEEGNWCWPWWVWPLDCLLNCLGSQRLTVRHVPTSLWPTADLQRVTRPPSQLLLPVFDVVHQIFEAVDSDLLMCTVYLFSVQPICWPKKSSLLRKKIQMETFLLIFCITKPTFPAKVQVIILFQKVFSTWYKTELNGSM